MAASPTPHKRGESPRLSQLQRWMQACIVANGQVEAAIETEAAAKEIPANEASGLIRPSRTLAPLERLDIYRGMYELRLVEALRVDYPGLIQYLGEDRFDELARLYVSAHPSQSYTLNRLGDRLPNFIQQVDGIPRPRFVEALARLELLETLVFDEEESPVATSVSIAGVGQENWGGLRLRPIRALRLVRLDYPVHEFMQAFRRGAPPPSLRPRRTHLIVYRREFGLFHFPVSAPAFALLQALAEGAMLEEAMHAMFEVGGGSQKQVFEWFRQWFGEKLFQSVEVS